MHIGPDNHGQIPFRSQAEDPDAFRRNDGFEGPLTAAAVVFGPELPDLPAAFFRQTQPGQLDGFPPRLAGVLRSTSHGSLCEPDAKINKRNDASIGVLNPEMNKSEREYRVSGIGVVKLFYDSAKPQRGDGI